MPRRAARTQAEQAKQLEIRLRDGILNVTRNGTSMSTNSKTEISLARRAFNFAVGAAAASLSDAIRWAFGGKYYVLAYGALGDGSGDTIAEWIVGGAHATKVNNGKGYADLTAIKVDFPHATALTDTIDWVATQAAYNAAAAAGGGTVEFPPLEFHWNQTLVMDTDSVALKGSGMSATIIRLIANVDGIHVLADHASIKDMSIRTDGLRDGTTTGIVVGGGNNDDPYGYRLASHVKIEDVRVSGDSTAKDFKYGVRWVHGPYLILDNVDLWYCYVGLYGDAYNVDNNHGVLNFYANGCSKWGMLIEYGKYWADYTVTYTGKTGLFPTGKTLTGATSGATGIIKTDSSGTMTLYNSSILRSTYYSVGEIIRVDTDVTATTSGATATTTVTVGAGEADAFTAGRKVKYTIEGVAEYRTISAASGATITLSTAPSDTIADGSTITEIGEATVATADGASWLAGTTARDWENNVIPFWTVSSNHCREHQFINCKTFECGTQDDFDSGGYRIDTEDNEGYLFAENGIGGSAISNVRELWLTPSSQANLIYAPNYMFRTNAVVDNGDGNAYRGRNSNGDMQWQGVQMKSFQLRDPITGGSKVGYLEYSHPASNTFDATAKDTGDGVITERRRTGNGIYQRHLYDAGENAFELSATDMGNDAPGPQLRVNQNSNASAKNPGTIRLQNDNGTFYYLWVDNTGDLRIHHSPPGTVTKDLVSITGDGATVTAATDGVHSWKTGDSITIAGTASYNGTYTITVTSTSTFTFASAATGLEEDTGTASIILGQAAGTVVGTQT